MLTIDPESLNVTAYPIPVMEPDPADTGTPIAGKAALEVLIDSKPGEWAVRFWNSLPGVVPIQASAHEQSRGRLPKFRNRETAVNRIWGKLCKLFPDAILESDKVMAKQHEIKHQKKASSADQRIAPSRSQTSKRKPSHARRATTSDGNNKPRRASSWASELETELRERFKPGEDFTLEDVYKLVPAFQRRHKENHHIAARLRTTLAQDLRGNGIVKSTGRGKYRMGSKP